MLDFLELMILVALLAIFAFTRLRFYLTSTEILKIYVPDVSNSKIIYYPDRVTYSTSCSIASRHYITHSILTKITFNFYYGPFSLSKNLIEYSKQCDEGYFEIVLPRELRIPFEMALTNGDGAILNLLFIKNKFPHDYPTAGKLQSMEFVTKSDLQLILVDSIKTLLDSAQNELPSNGV